MNKASRSANRADQSFSDAHNEEVSRASGADATHPLFVPHLERLEVSMNLADESTAADEYSAILESICGIRDDSQPVERYDGMLGVTTAFVSAHQRPACQVQWNNNLGSIYSNPGNVNGVRWGSATMITNDLLLTCGHLFDQTGGGWDRPRQNGTTNIISPQEIARNMRVNFNYQVDPSGNLRTEQSFPILELIEYRLGGLDMAICRVGGNPGAVFGTTQVSSTDAASPNMICIIGHPAGQPKRIEAGPTTAIAGNLIRYNDIDTLGGNSGSGILRASDGRLVGIHTNGGCTSGSPGDGGSNYGQRIAAVIAASPTLRGLVAPKSKFLDDPVSLKFRDDMPVTLKFRDDLAPVTLKFRDDVFKQPQFDRPPKFKAPDDIKQPVLDKRVGMEGKLPAADIGHGGHIPAPLPPLWETRGARPFILSTPHHSDAWQAAYGGGYADETQDWNSMVAEYQQAIAQAEADLQQLYAEYGELMARAQSGGTGQQYQ